MGIQALYYVFLMDVFYHSVFRNQEGVQHKPRAESEPLDKPFLLTKSQNFSLCIHKLRK